MGNDWEWNGNQGEPETGNLENKIDETAEYGEVSAKAEAQEEIPAEDVTGAERIAEEAPIGETPIEESSAGEQPAEAPRSEGPETYHWVNPRYQQQGAANAETNTYENQNYRERVGGEQQENLYRKPGYQGGAYHSDWQNQGQPYSGPETGRRHYGSYPFNSVNQENEPNTEKKRERKPMGTGKKFLVTAGMAVVFGLVAGGVMFGVNTLGNHLTGQNKTPETRVQIPSTNQPDAGTGSSEAVSGAVSQNTSGTFTVAQVAENCMPSVVSITNASVQTVNDFFGGVQEWPTESSGSGIIVGQNDTELLIATNNHVVEGAETLTVAFTDDAVCEAQTKGTDSNNDLAVIAVKLEDLTDETLKAIKIVSLGDSDALEIGEQVVAIGNALGYGQSVTSGWVSAVGRSVTDQNGKISEKLIQTDAAINPGNSGGALLNMKGELIGINVAKALATEVEGMGYAIPVSTAQPILDELMNRQTRYKADENKAAYIGVICLNVESSAVEMYGIPAGAFVDSVEEGGPAEKAGIQKGDVIVKFDGQTVLGSSELVSKLEYYEAGETVEVVISRAENGEYKEQTVTVTLGRRSEMEQTTPQR